MENKQLDTLSGWMKSLSLYVIVHLGREVAVCHLERRRSTVTPLKSIPSTNNRRSIDLRQENKEGKSFRVYLPVIIEHLCKHAGVSIEKELVEDWIVVGKRFGEARQPSGGNFLECRLVGLMPDAADIEHHPILWVHIVLVLIHSWRRWWISKW